MTPGLGPIGVALLWAGGSFLALLGMLASGMLISLGVSRRDPIPVVYGILLVFFMALAACIGFGV